MVPNGPDDSWSTVAESYRHQPFVKWHPISTPHANVARNFGMGKALGYYIRFLDDDDWLYPEACCKQLEALRESGCDLSSGAIDVVAHDRGRIKRLGQPMTADFVVSALCPQRMTHPCGHIYSREKLFPVRWDESLLVRQDTAWLIELACSQELRWHRLDEAVGAWVQHHGQRLSRGRDPGAAALKATAELIQRSFLALDQQGRLTTERREAASDALWSSLQKGLRYDWNYWSSVAKLAETYSPGRRPPSAMHRMRIAKYVSPIVLETLLIPIRIAFHPLRRILDRLGINRV